MPPRAYKIMFIAGEESGDAHASAVIRALRENANRQRFDFFGMGLEKTKKAGMRQLVNASELALVGIAELLRHYPKIKRAYRHLQRALKEEAPDLLVLVDYPEFNLKLAGYARRQRVKTLFYISPQIWAWRKKRIKTIARRIDMMAVIFPFEEKIYLDAGVPVRYVGHPLIDEMRNSSLEQSDSSDKKKTTRGKIILLPGSRITEVKRLLPVMCQAAKKIAAQIPTARFSLLLSSNISAAFVREQLQKYRLDCDLIEIHPYTAMRTSDVAITASGTATLQLACCGTPMVIVYKLSWITYALAKKLIRIPYIGMVNIIAGKSIAPELIQKAANPDNICREVLSLLENNDRKRQIVDELNQVKQMLGNGGAATEVARLIREMVETEKTRRGILDKPETAENR